MELQPADQQILTCEYCKNRVETSDVFCHHCGFPLHGTEVEQKNFNYNIGVKQLDLERTNTEIRKATNSLYVVAGVFAVYGFIYYLMNQEMAGALALVITNFVLGVIFLLLALWSKSKPIAAIISALALYTALHLVNFILDPTTLFQGAIMKVFIYLYLVRGLQSAFAAQKISKSLKVR